MKDFEDECYEYDGWNLFTIAETGLLEALSEAAAIDYELRNGVRGSYGISGDTVSDLKDDLLQLAIKLQEIAEGL